MKVKDLKEYEALRSVEARAKWLLKKGVTAKTDIDPKKMELTVKAYACGVCLPGDYKTTEHAIAGGTAWLAEKAGLANEKVGMQ